jgi:fumarylacetoacetate (FAA) hydrolase family protein
VERERRNRSFVWVDPFSKWMNHSQEIKGLVVGNCKRVGAHMKSDLDLKEWPSDFSTRCALALYKKKTTIFDN